MATPPVTHRTTRRPGRRGLLLVALATCLVTAATVPFLPTGAGALPPPCPDGSPAPCEPPDTTPTTRPTTTTIVTNPVWSTRVNVLNQSPMPVASTVFGSWGRAGTPYSTPSGTVAWNPLLPGEGTVSLGSTYLPGTGLVGFRLTESNVGGRLCRGFPFGAISHTNKNTHVLTAPTSVTNQAQLTAMAQGLVGPVSGIDGADVKVTHADLTARNDGLFLRIGIHVYADLPFPASSINADFGYSTLLHIQPGLSIDKPNEVMLVHADQGTLDPDGHNTTTDVLLWFAGDLEPDFRDIVQTKAQDAVNNAVGAQADVQWFKALGYVVSARKVTISTAGLTVFPSLCKVDF